jgi:Polyketide cyclase / dehydrase and lipid transport
MTITVTNTVDIDRPPADVWAVVSDYATDTRWRKGIVEMTPDTDGPPQVGTRVREVLELAGRTYTTETAVTDVGPGLTYGFTGTGTSGQVSGRRTVTSGVSADSARFSYDVRLEPDDTMPRAVAPLLARWLRHSMRRDLRRLRRLIEATP